MRHVEGATCMMATVIIQPAIMKRLKVDFMHAIAHEETAQAIKTIWMNQNVQTPNSIKTFQWLQDNININSRSIAFISNGQSEKSFNYNKYSTCSSG
jgi:hypothetical protein